MKKRNLVIISMLLLLAILFVPIKLTYKDGGTKTYNALLYKIINWHKLDDDYSSGYKTGKEVFWFPKSLKPLKYFEEHKPFNMYIIHNKKEYKTNRLSYVWCDEYGDEKYCSEALSLGPAVIDYKEIINVKVGDILKLSPEIIMTNVTFMGEKDILDYDLSQDKTQITIPKIKGEYIVDIFYKCFEGTVDYSFKLNITK